MRDSESPSWRTHWRASLICGSVIGGIAAIPLFLVMLLSGHVLSVGMLILASLWACGGLLVGLFVGIVVGLPIMRLSAVAMRIAASIPFIARSRWRWLAFAVVVAGNVWAANMVVAAIPIPMVQLFIFTSLARIAGLVFGVAAWFTLVRWYPLFRLKTARQVVAQRVGGALFTLAGIVALVQSPHVFERWPDQIPRDYLVSWLHDTQCRQPCWEGIRPGITTSAQAVERLRQLPTVNPSSVIDDSELSVVTWQWVESRDAGSGGNAWYDEKTGIVQQLIPYFEGIPGSDGSIALREVIDALGPPSHIIAYRVNGDYSVTLLYAAAGISLEQGSLSGSPPQLSPDMRFDQIIFRAVAEKITCDARPWRGFLDFEAYNPVDAPRIPMPPTCDP